MDLSATIKKMEEVDLQKVRFRARLRENTLHSADAICTTAKAQTWSWEDLKTLQVCDQCASSIKHLGGWTSLTGTLTEVAAIQRFHEASITLQKKDPLERVDRQDIFYAFRWALGACAMPTSFDKWAREQLKPLLEILDNGLSRQKAEELLGVTQGAGVSLIVNPEPRLDESIIESFRRPTKEVEKRFVYGTKILATLLYNSYCTTEVALVPRALGEYCERYWVGTVIHLEREPGRTVLETFKALVGDQSYNVRGQQAKELLKTARLLDEQG